MSRRARRDDYDEQDDGDNPQASGYLLVQLSRAYRNIPGTGGGSKIFHETDVDHPNNGEALITGDAVVRVYPTQRVRRAIASGLLTDVTGRREETERGPDMADLLESGEITPFPPSAAATDGAPTIGGAATPSVADGDDQESAPTARRKR